MRGMIPAIKLLVSRGSVVERGHAMWNFITQVGPASGTVTFANDLSLLVVGLVGLVWVSVGMIAFEAVRYYLSEKTQPTATVPPSAVDYREAA